MDIGDFNNNFLNNLLDEVSKEQKSVFLLVDFNITLLNYNYHDAVILFQVFCPRC